jgi:hypothetical protein
MVNTGPRPLWGTTNPFTPCSLRLSWSQIAVLQRSNPDDIRTGGLGQLMVPGRYEVWLCQFSHWCANGTDPMCFVFSEVQKDFVPWGLNSQVQLVKGSVFGGVELATSVLTASLKQTQAELQTNLSAMQLQVTQIAEQSSHDAQLAFLAGARCPANSLNAASASSVFTCDCPANSYLNIGRLTVQCTQCPNGTVSPAGNKNASFCHAMAACDGTVALNKCWKLFSTPLGWQDAENACVAWGGHLASISSAAESALVSSMIPAASTGIVWIGLYSKSYWGNWVWLDGSPVTYSNWASGEPNGEFYGEFYGQIYRDTGLWNDLAGGNYDYLCKN